ncbi:prolipoprotein diacylglyceryl transferase family protein [Spiroplasma taiwanense]|uniref:Prolipoprotein diacylglyceryl transferase n=1 Tax=Spiroplasma taiwanense CT-1 TaxID=1276220 RepID=S5LYM9_9MOLU|nr:prolipoprotein diacylglyceryl transferase family protein [Spiroplasma taiwanense]AGR40767.1 prolipoprotein diacylglyceryl transferase [Spiroplasma taiwanense CT-1]
MINFLSDIWVNGNPIPDYYDYGSGKYADPLSFLYSIFVLIGVFSVIITSAIRLHMRGIPLKEFLNGIYIALPLGVIGASIFGKLGSSGEDWKIYRLIFFWEPGMSFFGSMLVGGSAAFLWFWYKKRITRISIYTYSDCIVPNILLGQSIGRWGNLFNHEIMGRAIEDSKMSSITWLPDWIWHRLFYFYNPSNGQEPLKVLQFHEPLFLYESLLTLFLWFLLIFVFSNLDKWFSKKPWKIDPYAFPCKQNKICKFLDESKIINYQTQIPIKYNKNSLEQLSLSKKWVWRKAYLLYEPNIIDVENQQNYIYDQKIKRVKANEKFNQIKLKKHQEFEKIKLKFKKNKIGKEKYKEDIKILNDKYKNDLSKFRKNKSILISFLKRDSKKLYNLNNPNNYFVIHCGFLTGIYICAYTIIRFILDKFRNPYEISVKMNPLLNYLSLTGILIIGIIIMVCAQFIAPKKWREVGWLYEKSY